MTVSLEKAVIARLVVSGKKFEILVDPEKALEFRNGKNIDLDDILAIPNVYRNARASELAPMSEIQQAFGTTDVYKVAERILKKGEIQLTTEQRNKMIQQKKMQIATIISKRGINPQTNTPHPPQRILKAMEEAGVRVDPFIDAELQVDNVVKRIRSILPIKFEKVVIELKIPAQFAGRSYNILKSSGDVLEEKWLDDGSLQVQISILAGIQDEFFKKISDLTHGNFQSKIVRREEI